MPLSAAAQAIYDLPTGKLFTVSLEGMTWRDRQAILYYTDTRNVQLSLEDGTYLEGKLSEAPSFWAQNPRVWLRIPGRKTRKGVKATDIVMWTGYRAPTLAELVEQVIKMV